ARERLGADHQRPLEIAGTQEIVGGRKAVDEAGAHRLQVEGGTTGQAERRLHGHRGGGKCVVGGRRRKHDEIDVPGIDLGILEGGPGGNDREIRGGLAVGGDAPLADPGTLDDPLVARVDHLGEFVIGENAFGQVCAAAQEHGTFDTQLTPTSSTIAAGTSPRGSRALMSVLIRPTRSLRAMSIARSIALANPIASALPWLLTTMPLRPTKTPPFMVLGSSFSRSAAKAPRARR